MVNGCKHIITVCKVQRHVWKGLVQWKLPQLLGPVYARGQRTERKCSISNWPVCNVTLPLKYLARLVPLFPSVSKFHSPADESGCKLIRLWCLPSPSQGFLHDVRKSVKFYCIAFFLIENWIKNIIHKICHGDLSYQTGLNLLILD